METEKDGLLFSDSLTASSSSPQLLNSGVPPPRTSFCICIYSLGDLIQIYYFKYNMQVTFEQHRFELCKSTYT